LKFGEWQEKTSGQTFFLQKKILQIQQKTLPVVESSVNGHNLKVALKWIEWEILGFCESNREVNLLFHQSFKVIKMSFK